MFPHMRVVESVYGTRYKVSVHCSGASEVVRYLRKNSLLGVFNVIFYVSAVNVAPRSTKLKSAFNVYF